MAKKLSYLDWVRKFDKGDQYVLFLLGLGFSVAQTANLMHMTRANVYLVIDRNAQMLEEYVGNMKEILQRIDIQIQEELAKET